MAGESPKQPIDVVGTIRQRMKESLESQDVISDAQADSAIAYLLSGERLSPDRLLETLAAPMEDEDADS